MDGCKVWVVHTNRNDIDFRAAKEYGDLRSLFSGYIDLTNDKLGRLVYHAVNRMEDGDYVLLSGNKLLNALVVHQVFSKFGKAKILNYDSRQAKYQEFGLCDMLLPL